MLCTIAFCLANLYVDVELSNPRYYVEIRKDKQDYSRLEGYWCTNHPCKGPLADLTIGMPVQITDSLRVAYGYKHSSFPLEPRDKGQDGWFVSLKWEPFK